MLLEDIRRWTRLWWQKERPVMRDEGVIRGGDIRMGVERVLLEGVLSECVLLDGYEDVL